MAGPVSSMTVNICDRTFIWSKHDYDLMQQAEICDSSRKWSCYLGESIVCVIKVTIWTEATIMRTSESVWLKTREKIQLL